MHLNSAEDSFRDTEGRTRVLAWKFVHLSKGSTRVPGLCPVQCPANRRREKRIQFVYLSKVNPCSRVVRSSAQPIARREKRIQDHCLALMHRQFELALLHHSDRGAQYAAGVHPSATGAQPPEQGAARRVQGTRPCESFLKTLKYEEVCSG